MRAGPGDRVFDVCIVGGGMAGITLAMELRDTPLSVCLLESGAESLDTATQALYAGTIDGNYSYELDECRARWLGGSSNRWAGSCAPLDPIDFTRRAWVGDVEWPICHDDVAPYYPRAAAYCALQSSDFSPDAAGTSLASMLGDTIWMSRRLQVSQAPRFGGRFAAALRDAPNVTLWLGATVVSIACEAHGRRVRHVVVQPLDRPRFIVRARTFVIAAGGIENARLLLASNDVHRAGLGNANDLVGRYFMDHPVIASVMLEPAPSLDLSAFALPPPPGIGAAHFLQLRESALIALRTTNVRVHLTPASDLSMSTAMLSYQYMRLCLRRRRWPRSALRRLGRLVTGGHVLGAHFASRLGRRGGRLTVPRPDRLRVSIMCEQLPRAENRVTLGTSRDAVGLPRVRVTWQMRDDEHARAGWVIDRLAEDFRAAGIGRIRHLSADPDHPFEERLGFGNHAIGTTRAAADPRAGVVDRDGRVFGIENLFVAGSSIFPTSSHVPPSLCIVALAIRLAEHLGSAIGASARLRVTPPRR